MYEIGDRVVHPMHGAGTIAEIVEQKVSGKKAQYYLFNMIYGGMTLMIPVDNSEGVGVRPVCGDGEAYRIIDEIAVIELDENTNWNRRYRENMVRVKSGNLHDVAGVVKSLVLRERERGLSTGERKMLHSARQILVSELAMAIGNTIKQTEDMLEHAIIAGSAQLVM